MDDEFTTLELELKRLRPRTLPAIVVNRIAVELEPQTAGIARPSWFVTASRWMSSNWRIGAASAAALGALAVGLHLAAAPGATQSREGISTPQPARPADTELKPVAAESILYDVRDEGLVTLDDGREGRRVRQRYLDTITWSAPDARRSLRWTVPREEVRILPVVFQ